MLRKFLRRTFLPPAFRALAALMLAGASLAAAQPLEPGAAIVTHFGGAREEAGRFVLDPDAGVVSALDLGDPGAPPSGARAASVGRRVLATAGEIGSVFGVALDDSSPPNVYLTASAAFGLHRTLDGAGWAEGMWGRGGGPGSVWRLVAERDHAPELFATIRLDGRENTGAALGAIAFDPWRRQFYVSDLETGMIHRLDAETGEDRGRFDHGVDGRLRFLDAEAGAEASLDALPFDPASAARVADCPQGAFENEPACWNRAAPGRRVDGLAVRLDEASGETRLHYAVAEAEGVNALWSIAITREGAFDLASVRREAVLPEAPAGAEVAAASLAFAESPDGPVMLVAERGVPRNLGLSARSPFAAPHAAPVLRLRLSQAGLWELDGRYDVGFYDRSREGPPHIRANAAGGVAVGFAHDAQGRLDGERFGEFVWMTADALCSPEGPCVAQDGSIADAGPANGVQGLPLDAFAEPLPEAALAPYPLTGTPYPPDGLLRGFVVDLDEGARRDFGRMGAIAIVSPPVVSPPVFSPESLAASAAAPPAGFPAGAFPPSPFAEAPPVPPELTGSSWWPPAPSGAGQAAGPDLLLRKAAPAPTCAPGSDCDFVVVVTNAGATPIAGPIRISDTLPAGWTLSGFGPPGAGWACAQGAERVVCDLPGVALPVGESLALTLRVGVPAAAAPGAAANCATLAGAASFGDVDPSNDGACVAVTVSGGAPGGVGQGGAGAPPAGVDLSLAKSAPGAITATDPSLPGLRICRPGEPCRFSIAVRNDGQAPYQGPLQIVDAIPAGWSYVSADAGWICMLQMGGPLVGCSNADVSLAPGQSLVMALTLRAPQTQTLASAQNCARIHWPAGADVDPGNDSDCTTVSVLPPEASVLAPAPLPTGAEAAPPAPTGFGIVAGPQGVAYDIAIDKSARHAGQAQAAGAGALHVCQPGAPCAFAVTITNAGAERFSGPFRFTDEAPSGWSFASVDSGWSCAPAGSDRFSCSGQLALEPGQSSTLTLALDPGAANLLQPAAFENCVAIDWTAAQRDGNPANDRSCAPVMLAPVAGMTAGPAATAPQEERADVRVWIRGPDYCEPGETCEFLIGVEGLNDIGFTQPFTVLDTLPEGWDFVSGGAEGNWSCQRLTDRVNCLYDITKWSKRPAGGLTTSERFGTDILLRVPADETRGSVRNCAILTFPPGVVPDITAPQYFACADVAIARPSEVTLEKRFDEGPCVAGRACGFSITIGNAGKERYDGLVTLTDIAGNGVAAPLGLGAGAGAGWTCSLGPGADSIGCEGYLSLLPGDRSILRFELLPTPGRAPPYEARNCATLWEYDAKLPLDTADDRRVMARRFLLTQGYDLPAAPTQAQFDAAIVDYKTNRADVRDASGARDLSPDVTDALVKHILPGRFDKGLGEGRTLEACAVAAFDAPALLVDKTPGTPANDPVAAAKGLCVIGQDCSWTITVSGRDETPFVEPIRIRDTLPENWRLVDFSPRGSWSCTSSGRIVDCAHPAANLSRASAPLTLRLTARSDADPPGRYPEIRNCVEIRHATPAQAAVQPRSEWLVCQEQNLTRSDQNLADFVATGSGRCTPPNCTFYEFAFTRRAFANRGPVTFTITPPAGSSFPAPAVTQAPAACAVPGWSCRRAASAADSALVCENRDCALSPGDRVSVRIDGSVAPDLREPPPADIDKEACAVAAWDEEAPPSTGIEQNLPVARRLEACHNVVVAGRAAPAEIDLALAKTTAGDCVPGGSCRFRLTVSNRSATPFRGPIALTDEFSDPGMRLVGAGGGLDCAQNGARLTCLSAPVEIAASAERIFALDVTLPASSRAGWIENCAALQSLDAAGAASSRESIRLLQYALNARGYDAGPVDGVIGRRTRAAIAAARDALALPGGDGFDSALLRRLADPDGLSGPDPVSANDRACVRVDMPRPAPTPAAPQTRPQQTAPATPAIVCENGVVRDGVCHCPAGWTRREVATRRYVCEPPRATRPSPTPAPAPILCIGGAVRGGECVCPSGWNRLNILPGVYQCEPRAPAPSPRPAPAPMPAPTPAPAPQQPPLWQVIPQIVPPQPQFQMICPPGTRWVPEAGQCIRIID